MNPLTPSLAPSEGERVAGGRVRGAFGFKGAMRVQSSGRSFHEPDFGRDIALRCPRPSSSVPGSPPPEGLGVGSWPQLTSNFLEVFPLHEPGRLRVADPRSGPRLCEAQRFKVPMRAQKRKEASHEVAGWRRRKQSVSQTESNHRAARFNVSGPTQRVLYFLTHQSPSMTGRCRWP